MSNDSNNTNDNNNKNNNTTSSPESPLRRNETTIGKERIIERSDFTTRRQSSSMMTQLISNCTSQNNNNNNNNNIASSQNIEDSCHDDNDDDDDYYSSFQRKRIPQHIEATDNNSTETQSSSNATSQQHHRTDEEENNSNLNYYRIVYKGIVALVESTKPNAARTGSYLSYGEIFTSTDNDTNNVDAVQVHSVLTGGYATDDKDNDCNNNDNNNNSNNNHHNDIYNHHLYSNTFDGTEVTPKRSNITTNVTGYVVLKQNNNQLIAEKIIDSIPTTEIGIFYYKIISSTPIPILTGPCIDAPKTKAVLLPGSIQEISLRISYADTITFLRLSHHRGWIIDRKFTKITSKQKQKQKQQSSTSIPVVQQIILPSSTSEQTSSVLSDHHSTDGSIISVVSSVANTSISTRSRHRLPRRRRDAKEKNNDSNTARLQLHHHHHHHHNPPFKQVIGDTVGDRSNNTAFPPSSNISILSDDSSLLLDHNNKGSRHSTTQQLLQHPTSPDTSFATSKSAVSSTSITPTNKVQHNFFLIRVHAPRGLKILDAPQFQVNNLIRHPKHNNNNNNATITNVSSSHMVSKTEINNNNNVIKNHNSIFQTMSGRLTTTGPSQSTNPAMFDVNSKTRYLPRGVLFEASTRMETTGAYSQGAGLIKLSDNSGWVIVPRQDELEHQYRKYNSGTTTGSSSGRNKNSNNGKQASLLPAFEEVGSASIETASTITTTTTTSTVTSDTTNSIGRNTVWLRVMVRSGVTVACPPPIISSSDNNDDETSPTSSRGSSAVATTSNPGSTLTSGQVNSTDSDVASSVGSAFLDAMFRTPKKKDPNVVSQPSEPITTQNHNNNNNDRIHQSNSIPCGTFLEVERWAPGISSNQQKMGREYARLCGGQGWVPLNLSGKPTTARVSRPEFRFGSFWFRVQSSRGLKVRLGPSKRAPSIKSDDGVYFRFECGEFLRASEIITNFGENGEPTESFAKLYRNRHVRLHTPHEDFRPLPSLTMQAEWVQIYNDNELFLEECSAEPRIERHKQGWRYDVVPEDGIAVRRGPSFAAEKTGIILFGGEGVVINERVTPPGDKITWLRMKDGQGWVHDIDLENKPMMIAHSLRHRAKTSRPRKTPVSKEGGEIAYNAIIARLFHNDEPFRPEKDTKLKR